MSNLTKRAHGEEVEDRRPQGVTLADQIKQMEAQYALAMPKGAEAAQLVRDALTLLRTTPKLAECQPATVLGGLMTFAQLGLRPGTLGHGWLLPFWDKRSRTFKAQVVIGYQGLIELSYRSSRVSSLIARTVYEKDVFDVDYGTADRIVHKPNLLGDRGRPVAYYAKATIKDGGDVFYVMTRAEAEKYRDTYAMARTKDGKIVGPWLDNFDGMAQKTCVRQLSKWLPKSTDLAVAIEVDNGVRINVDPTADLTEVTHQFEPEVVDGEVVDPETGEIHGDQPEAS